MASQNSAATAASRARWPLHFRCMKNKPTRLALTMAMRSAATVLNGPRSTYATAVVSAVRPIRSAKIKAYIFRGAMCSATVTPSDEIKEREKEDPDDIHEVPVEAGHLDGVRVLGGEMAARRKHDE